MGMNMNVSFTLHPIAPYRLDYTVLALRRRSKNNAFPTAEDISHRSVIELKNGL